MDSDKKKSKIPIIALIISLLAMVGAVGSFLFTVWKYKQQEKTNLTISCEILYNSKVEFKDSNFPVAINKKGGIRASTDKDGRYILDPSDVPSGYTYYPKVITFSVECKITNLSSKKATIEEIYGVVHFSKISKLGVIHPALFQGISDYGGEQITIPRLLDQGEQVVYFIKVGWLLDQTLAKSVETTCKPDSTIEDLYVCLFRNGFDLNYESDGVTLRTFSVKVKTADGLEFSEPVEFSFIVLPNP